LKWKVREEKVLGFVGVREKKREMGKESERKRRTKCLNPGIVKPSAANSIFFPL